MLATGVPWLPSTTVPVMVSAAAGRATQRMAVASSRPTLVGPGKIAVSLCRRRLGVLAAAVRAEAVAGAT